MRQLVFREEGLPPIPGTLVYLVIPLGLAIAAAMWFIRVQNRGELAERFLRPLLLLGTWLFFGLNFAFFHFPWPWQEWTQRTPNAMVFTICALGLTWFACSRSLEQKAERVRSPEQEAAAS